jgi:hypothetical protein
LGFIPYTNRFFLCILFCKFFFFRSTICLRIILCLSIQNHHFFFFCALYLYFLAAF